MENAIRRHERAQESGHPHQNLPNKSSEAISPRNKTSQKRRARGTAGFPPCLDGRYEEALSKSREPVAHARAQLKNGNPDKIQAQRTLRSGSVTIGGLHTGKSAPQVESIATGKGEVRRKARCSLAEGRGNIDQPPASAGAQRATQTCQSSTRPARAPGRAFYPLARRPPAFCEPSPRSCQPPSSLPSAAAPPSGSFCLFPYSPRLHEARSILSSPLGPRMHVEARVNACEACQKSLPVQTTAPHLCPAGMHPRKRREGCPCVLTSRWDGSATESKHQRESKGTWSKPSFFLAPPLESSVIMACEERV